MELIKPKRSFSRSTVIGTLAPAWAAIAWSIHEGVAMAQVVVPLMVVLIASVIGVYQGIGHFDLRSQLGAGARPRRAPRAPRAEGA
ncbi:MAG TPA: hypothetical protein VGV17_23995 [Bosea sp. (in: a-proteobacteria)]|jgi:hypothetical protein|uniref:hypothetical protein n=1 Tax=Bosea sp. (in: a-proteobacteria) TaxID=1871050 RepID=UPI002DDD5E26|nr:hypothetical protein [Bosea sp. (in: a-proteobacteria)]HEV2556825.1 hypothetical protein [Bosea sp. (in: a-proteobacteria)]